MANQTTNIDQISSGQSQKEVALNSLMDAASPATLLGRRADTTAGLVFGLYGGTVRLDDGSLVQIANGTKTLTNTATNYIEMDSSDGSVSVNTSGWTGGSVRLYEVVVAGGAVTNYIDWRTIGGVGAVGPVAADAVTIDDAGGYFSTDATDVEAALQELGAALGGGLSDGDKGDITVSGSGATWTIDNDAVTYAKMQNVSATDMLLGRSTAGAGNVEEIPCTAFARSILDDTTAAAVRATIGAGTGTGSGDALVANPLSQFAATTSAQLRGVLSDETGTGLVVFNDSPTLITPALGTPASGNLANCTIPVVFQIACSDEATALTSGSAKVTFRAPYAFTLTAVRASVKTAPTGGTLLTVDINESSTTVLSTKLTFDASEKTTTTAATAAVISDSAIADDAEISIDIDSVGSTVAGAGLKVTLIGTKP